MFRTTRSKNRSHARSTPKHPAIARAADAAVCTFEAMERRQLMSATLLSSGNLTIIGTPGDDRISISVDAGNNTVTVNDNGTPRVFALNQVTSVYVTVDNGNDSFSSTSRLNVPMVINGGNDHDTLSGGGGADQIYGGPGNDVIHNTAGADVMSGGSGHDQVRYSASTAGVSVTLDGVANDGKYTNSFFQSREFDNVQSDIEEVHGSAYKDYLSASGLYGRGATLGGSYGDDYIVGSEYADVLYGSFGNDSIYGNGGNDSVWGGLGADLMKGGTGIDDVRYDAPGEGRTSGVFVSLPNAGVNLEGNNGARGENDRLGGDFESVWGTNYADGLSGNNVGNWLYGLGGGDFMQGRQGTDRLYGSDGVDTLMGDAGNDFLWGEAGSDKLYGGADWDDVRYDEAGRSGGVNAMLNGKGFTGYGGDKYNGEYDTIYDDVEALVGSRFNDFLIGNAYNNYLAGLDGNDTIYGNAGDDFIDGGNGADRLSGDGDNDYIVAKDGAYTDIVNGGHGYDTVLRDRTIFGRYFDSVVYAEDIK